MAKSNLITTAEAAEIIGVSQRMVVKYIHAQKINAEVVSGKFYTTKGEARRIQRERAKTAKEAEKAKLRREKEAEKKKVQAEKKKSQKAAKPAKKGGKK